MWHAVKFYLGFSMNRSNIRIGQKNILQKPGSCLGIKCNEIMKLKVTKTFSTELTATPHGDIPTRDCPQKKHV